MRVVTSRDEQFYDKLVRLAGGDANLVLEVLSPQADRRSVDLPAVITEIKRRRSQQSGAPAARIGGA
jgi:hypothetical protein